MANAPVPVFQSDLPIPANLDRARADALGWAGGKAG